jgi:hypothetical protein
MTIQMRSALLVLEAIAAAAHSLHPESAITRTVTPRSIALDDSSTSYDQGKIQQADYANPD